MTDIRVEILEEQKALPRSADGTFELWALVMHLA